MNVIEKYKKTKVVTTITMTLYDLNYYELKQKYIFIYSVVNELQQITAFHPVHDVLS